MNIRRCILALVALFTVSCSEYQKLLKSTDPDLKYEKAVAYFEKKDYVRAQSLFDDISVYYKGTERSEEILKYLAECYIGQKDNASAVDYYKNYVRSYPKGVYVIEAKYMIGYCYYLDSPDARLDQTTTVDAINALQEFVDIYPESPRVKDANKLLDELYNKLAYKELLSARLYRNLGTYRGDNFQSAIIVANNALRKYPQNEYRDELSYIVLDAKYNKAKVSTADKQSDRLQEALDEYYSYINEFPEGKFRRNADKIYTELKKQIKD